MGFPSSETSGHVSLDREGDLNRPGNFGGSNASTQVQNDAFELIGNLEYARGLAHAELNQISEASDAYGRSRKAFTAAGSDDIDLAYLDRLDAAALGRTGRYGEALDVFRRAADTFSRLHFPQEVDGGILCSDQARSDDFPSALRPVFGIVDRSRSWSQSSSKDGPCVALAEGCCYVRSFPSRFLLTDQVDGNPDGELVSQPEPGPGYL